MIDAKTPLIDFFPFGVIFLDKNLTILFVNKFIEENFNKDKRSIFTKEVNEEFPGLFSEGESSSELITSMNYLHDKNKFIVQTNPFSDNGHFSGYTIFLYPESLFESITMQGDSYKNLSIDLQTIFDISYDVIYVADGNGNTLRVSSACEKLWGHKQEDLMGKNIFDLEKKGVFSPSITRLVLEKGEKVTSLQTTETGKRLMVIGTPIKDENGNIVRVVNASRDITEINRLQSELDATKLMMEGYRRELKALRSEKNSDNKLIYRNQQMRNIVTLAKKVAEANSTVLLSGESGVGKEVLANYIHNQSPRKNNPFISVDCGSLPESLMEGEMFGEKELLPSGEIKNVPGLFVLAHEGTLFLDEVAEMPMSLQVRLVRMLSEQERDPNKLNVRVIAATNHNLYEEVQNGRFRKDLFYQLNIVPIYIPPLRERAEDILPLSLYFLKQINQMYVLDKQLGHDILQVFSDYDWPGNVRELRNIIERLLVTSNKTIIGLESLPEHLKKQNDDEKVVQIKRVIPLKKAVELLERELLELAQKEHQSTSKIAELLDVNQSTISRKMQKYLRKQ